MRIGSFAKCFLLVILPAIASTGIFKDNVPKLMKKRYFIRQK